VRAGVQWHWTVRHRYWIATARTSALVATTLLLTAALELLVVLTIGIRAAEGSLLEATLITSVLAAAPPVTAGFALLWLRRSVPNYRRLLAETCFWVAASDVLVALLVLLG
jgi:hypothetical protein